MIPLHLVQNRYIVRPQIAVNAYYRGKIFDKKLSYRSTPCPLTQCYFSDSTCAQCHRLGLVNSVFNINK